ncbi:hypothetical protein F4818DRAFT_120638 [Hypoxylon cercidicola]|nr:hypothetical protein F4818DRAFT_120638 [Hypoxylon cercidicola]
MGIFPGGKSTRINSPRHLTLRHSRRLAAAHQRKARLLAGTAATEDDDEVDPLLPGQQKLNSYWAPGLEAGTKHIITATQDISANEGKETLSLNAEQSFFVDAPQFSLPEGSVHSTYPPPGYPDTNRILPHIVLTDPHLPWERLGSPSQGTNKELQSKVKSLLAKGVATDGDIPRNRVPWLVIFSFSQDELRLPPEDLDSIFQDTSNGVIKPVKQSGTLTVNTSIEDLWKLPTSDVVTPVTSKLGPLSMKDSRGDFIFVKPDLFKKFFQTEDPATGNPKTGAGPDTSQYQYMAHVRTINGQGMALAGVEDTAVFSIIISNRAGQLKNETPATMCAHLVSIEGVEDMAWPEPSHKYVALCSLYSWNYTVLPANTLNVPDAFEQLGRTLNVLRAPDRPSQTSPSTTEQLVEKRLQDGYTLVRYCTQTGESTVALYRGPLTPSRVPPLKNLTTSSNSGVDLQILDKQLGVMDITYSVAWQVGRTMALGNEAFTAALVRLRKWIHDYAENESKLQAVKGMGDSVFRTRADVLAGIGSTIRNLGSIHLGNNGQGNDNLRQPEHSPGRQPVLYLPGGAKRRWQRRRLDFFPDLSFGSPLIRKKYPVHAAKAARYLGQSTAGGPYDETNDPVSTDYMIVLSWLLDRMFFAGVPAHCLIPDPSYLEAESLRFFSIDKNWRDALIDGALSLGNHYRDDVDRQAIKEALNEYINHTSEGQDQPVQIPSYGFYLRSDLVTMFPDLRVEVLPDSEALAASGETAPTGTLLLRHEIVADGVMMALMDREPGSDQFAKLVFTQPAHQQRFAIARDVNLDEVAVDIRRQYTVDQSIREGDDDRHKILKNIEYKRDNPDKNIFTWDSKPGSGLNDLRLIWPPRFAAAQLEQLQKYMTDTYIDADGVERPYFQDDKPSSALFAMQLNDPVYNLTIDLKDHPPQEIAARPKPPTNPSSDLETRTLGLMNTARAKRRDRNGRAGRSPLKKDNNDNDDYGADFKRLSTYASRTALSRSLAPHIRTIPAASASNSVRRLPQSTTITTTASRKISTAPSLSSTKKKTQSVSSVDNYQAVVVAPSKPAGTPEYEVRVGSNIVGSWNIIRLNLIEGTEGTEGVYLPQDLVFSVILHQSPVSQWQLVEVDIEVDLGDLGNSNDTPSAPHFLMRNYEGPGAHMLTNLRFNVLLTTPTIDSNNPSNVLRIRLIPRSSQGWVYATTVSELSFLLGLADVNVPDKRVDQFSVRSEARYMINSNGGLDESNILKVPNPDTLVTVVNPGCETS